MLKDFEKDCVGLRSPDYVFRIKQFNGKIEYEEIKTASQLDAAIRLGRYLEKRGFERTSSLENKETHKFGWYFSTQDHGLTMHPLDEVRLYFAFQTQARLIAEVAVSA